MRPGLPRWGARPASLFLRHCRKDRGETLGRAVRVTKEERWLGQLKLEDDGLSCFIGHQVDPRISESLMPAGNSRQGSLGQLDLRGAWLARLNRLLVVQPVDQLPVATEHRLLRNRVAELAAQEQQRRLAAHVDRVEIGLD